MKARRNVLIVASLVLAALCCSQRPRDPVAVAKTYYLVGQMLTRSGLKQRYALLSSESRKTTSLDEYFQHYGATDTGRGANWTVDSISLMPEDKTLPTYRRVRVHTHYDKDTLHRFGVFYYTLANENGMWSVVWEIALLDRAGDMFQKGMLDEAIALCDKALALNPYSAGAYEQRAWCYVRQVPAGYQARQARDAAVELNAKKAVALEPEDPNHYNTLAQVYYVLDLPELQIEALQKAVHLPTCTPNGRVAYYSNISGAYSGMSRPEKAIAFADSALSIDSTNVFAWMKRAIAEYDLERTDSAKVSIDRALAADWANQLDKGLQFTLQFFAALIDERARDYEGALQHVLRALEMEPGNKGAQTIYSRVKRKTK